MTLIDETKQRILNTTTSIAGGVGRALLHSLKPDDFEYYACTLELTNSLGEIEQSLNFPIMPNQLMVNKQQPVNIKKTAGGVVSFTNNTFNPFSINISGTFGRKLKLIAFSQDTNTSESLTADINFNSPRLPNFELGIKTGYGVLKILENIVKSSTELDSTGNPKILAFYNQALNHNFVVEVLNIQIAQSLENNMLWNYTLDMKTIAPAEAIAFQDSSNKLFTKKKLNNLLAVSNITKDFNKFITNMSFSHTFDKSRGTLNKFTQR